MEAIVHELKAFKTLFLHHDKDLLQATGYECDRERKIIFP